MNLHYTKVNLKTDTHVYCLNSYILYTISYFLFTLDIRGFIISVMIYYNEIKIVTFSLYLHGQRNCHDSLLLQGSHSLLDLIGGWNSDLGV